MRTPNNLRAYSNFFTQPTVISYSSEFHTDAQFCKNRRDWLSGGESVSTTCTDVLTKYHRWWSAAERQTNLIYHYCTLHNKTLHVEAR